MSNEYALGSFVDSVCQEERRFGDDLPRKKSMLRHQSDPSSAMFIPMYYTSCLAFGFSEKLSVQSTERYSRPSPASTLPRCTCSPRRTLDTRTSTSRLLHHYTLRPDLSCTAHRDSRPASFSVLHASRTITDAPATV
jgi:hypothetical protein